jgi:hypothetical protein
MEIGARRSKFRGSCGAAHFWLRLKTSESSVQFWCGLRDRAATSACRQFGLVCSAWAIGRALLEAAEDHCRARGCTEMTLSTGSVRRELVDRYGRLGYRVTSIEPAPPDGPFTKPIDDSEDGEEAAGGVQDQHPGAVFSAAARCASGPALSGEPVYAAGDGGASSDPPLACSEFGMTSRVQIVDCWVRFGAALPCAWEEQRFSAA